MKILTFNVGIWTRNMSKSDPYYWKDRMNAMTRMIKDIDPDVICFQEFWFPANCYVPKNYHKVCGTGPEHPIFVKEGLKANGGRFSIHWSMANVEGLRIFSVHGHWGEDKNEKICASLRKAYMKEPTPAVMTGDFNVELQELIPTRIPDCMSARVELGLEREDTYIHFLDSSRRGELDHFISYSHHAKDFKIIKDGYGAPNDRISDHYPVLAIY